jgi:hypothetical protein
MQYKRTHIPTGSVYIGKFNGTQHWAFSDSAKANQKERSGAAFLLIREWNMQQPDTWHYVLIP